MGEVAKGPKGSHGKGPNETQRVHRFPWYTNWLHKTHVQIVFFWCFILEVANNWEASVEFLCFGCVVCFAKQPEMHIVCSCTFRDQRFPMFSVDGMQLMMSPAEAKSTLQLTSYVLNTFGRACSEQKVNRVWTVTAIHECWRQTETSTKSARETVQRNAIISRYAVTGSAPISMYIFYIRFWLFELSWFSISLHFDLDHQLCILSCCYFITMVVNSFCWSYW